MKFKSQVFTQASGSVGGLTYSHNSAGLYTRARAIPVNPNTSRQVVVRAALTTLVNRWLQTLTQLQRDAWELWAANTPTTDVLGDALILTGQQAYVSANTPRVQASDVQFNPLNGLPLLTAAAAIADDAPILFNRGEIGAISLSSSGGAIDLAFDNTQEWATTAGGVLLLYMSQPFNASRKFFRGPWRLQTAILGATPTAPMSPATVSNNIVGYVVAEGQKMRIKARALLPDGRTSSAVQTNDAIFTEV